MTYQPLFDLSILQEMDDSNFITQIISLYLEDTPKNLAEIKEAAANNDFSGVEKRIHKLKGSTAIFQSQQILDTIDELHESANGENKDGRLHDLVIKLENEYELLRNALNEYLAILKINA